LADGAPELVLERVDEEEVDLVRAQGMVDGADEAVCPGGEERIEWLWDAQTERGQYTARGRKRAR
jgi:hypothetical protein